MTSNQISDANRTNNAVFLIDLKSYTFRYVNDYACEKLGYSREELLQMGILDIDPLMNAASLQKITEQMTKPGFFLLETYHLTKAGRFFPVEVSGNVFDYQEARLGLFIARDLTEHNYKEAEKQHLIDILEKSADFIGSADMEGKLLYHNHAARRMMGLAEDADLSTMSIADICPAWVFQLMCETVIPTVIVYGTWQGETAILHQNGDEIPVFQTVVLHRDANKKPLFMSTIMHNLTERKQREAQLALLNYAFNYVDEAIYLIDENAQFVQVNEKACRDLGYTREELLQLKIFDIDPDYTPQHWKQRQEDIVQGVLSAIVETHHRTKDGRIFPIEVRASHIPYQGQLYDIAMVRDISERKQREAQLALMDYAFNYVDDEIFLINSDAQFLQVNEKACLSLGYSREELLSMGIFDIDPDFIYENWQNLLVAYEKGAKSITLETSHRTKDGVIFPVEVRGHYIVYQGQKYSFAMVRDITERKAAEKQLSLLNYALDHIKEEVWLIDENGRFRYVNPAACRSIGRPLAEMLQLSVLDIKPNYGLEQWREDQQHIKSMGAFTFETSHQSKEGTIFPVEVNANSFVFDGEDYSLALSHDITERKATERQLNLLSYALNHVGESVWLIDENAKFHYINKEVCRAVGYTHEELLTLGVPDVDPDFPFERWSEHWQALKAKGSIILESRLKTKDGHIFPIEVNANYFEFDGKSYNLAFVRDITERKAAEKQLSLLNYALDHVKEAVWLIDEQANFHYNNAEACRVIGYSREEMLQLGVPDIDPIYQLDTWSEHWQDLKTKGSLFFESLHRTRDGHVFPVDINANYFEFDGKGYNLALMRDITERKQAQVALQRSEALLAEAQRIAHIGSWEVDFVTGMLNWSDETFRIWEIEQSLFGATVEAFLDTIHPEDREKVANAYQASISNKTVYQIEHRLLFADGRVKYISERGEPFYDENGQIIRFVGTAADITERKATEKQLTLLNYALDHVKESAWLMDEAGNFHYLNQEACHSVGYTREEMLQLNISNLNADLPIKTWNTHWQALKEQKTLRFEVNHRTKEGHVFPVEVNANYFEFDGKAYNLALSHDITKRQRVEETLKFVAQHGWKDRNESFLVALTQYLAQLFQVDYVIIDKLGTSPTQAETVALCVKGAIVPNMQYDLKGTPCNDVINGKLCCYPERVQQLFPEDSLLVDMQAESYAGLPLWDTAGNVVGLIAVIDSKPLQNTDAISSILQLVATSVAAELERQHAEQRLLDSHHFLEQIINTIADPVFVKDREHRWILLNKAYCEYMGYSLEELLGKSDYDFHLPQEADVYWEKDELVFSTGVESINEETATNADGFVRTILTKKTCFTDSTGQQFLVGIITDLTKRKQMENALATREREFRTLAENVPGILIRFDEKCRMRYINQRLLEDCDQHNDPKIGQTLIQTYPNDALFAELHGIIENVIETGQPTEIERFFPGHQGGTTWTFHYVPESDDNGNIIGALALGQDISERKRMEDELVAREQKFRTLAENMPANISRYDVQGHLIYMNPMLSANLAPEAWQKDGTTLLESFPDSDSARAAHEAIMTAITTGEESELELVVPNRHGEMRIHQVRYVAEREPNGQIVGVIAIGQDITEQRAMALQLAAREREFRILVENSPVPISRYNTQCQPIYINPAVEKLLGKPANELLKWMMPSEASILDKQQAEKLEQALRQVITTGQVVEGEIECLVADGQLHYYQNRFAPELDAEGQVLSVILVSHDITERKHAEQLLAQREQEFRSLAENMPDNLIRYDLHARVCYLNPAIKRSLMPEILPKLNQTLSESFPDNVEAVEAQRVVEQVIATREKISFEVCVPNPEGEMRTHSLRYVPEYDHQGNLIGILAIGRDVTEHKEMERILRQREQEFRVLVETSPSPIIRYDAQCRRTYVNPAVERMAGKTAAQMLAHAPSEGTLLNEHVKNEIEHILHSVLTTGQITESEVELVLADGQTHYFYNRYAPELDANGKAVGVVLVGHDITARKQAEQLLVQREQEFRSLAENMPDNLLRYDTQGCLRYMNRAMLQSLAPEMLSEMRKSSSEVFADNNEESKKMRQLIDKVITTGETIEIEEMCLNPQGEIRAHRIRFMPELDNAGKIVGAFGIGRDITERKQMETAIKQHEQEFRTLVDNLPTVVLRYNRHLQRIYANPAYLQIMGKTEAELLSEPLEKTWMATNISVTSYKAILNQVMHDGEKQEVMLEWTNHHGELICHALKIVPEYAIDGEIQSALVLGFDFSEQRRQQLIETNRQQVFEKMAHNHSLQTILEQVALYVESAKAGSYCAILVMDEVKSALQLLAAPSFPETYCSKNQVLTLDAKSQHCFGWATAASYKERVIIENLQEHPCASFCQNFIRETQVVACWSEPIISSANQLLGVVTLYLTSTGQSDENDLAHLQKAAHLSAIAIERKRIEQQMVHQASYDALTELPNRRLFHNRLLEEISKAERRGHQLAVLFIDLDHFKDVNDTLGHQIGDNLLIRAAQRIQSCVRQSDTVARLGGDEFVVILPELGTIPPVERIAEAIIRAMTQPFILGEYHTYVSASVGIAMYPEDANNAEMLVSYADQAMYAAKQGGRNSFNFFKRSMQEQAQQRLYLVNGLRDALEKNQFEVYYQPIIEVSTGKAVKAEALLRWHHPALGMVSPAVFIPLAEETDLIQEIGSWVFCQAADMAKRWNTLSGANQPRKISINMSPRQLIKGRGDQMAIDYLQAIALDSNYIVVEITEGLLLDDSPHITEKLERLRNGGIQLSLDDFGTGYSAMAYLKKFEINYLKIDRSFVCELETNLDDRAITEAIVVMAHRLGLKVIAEGVETEGQLALLAAAGCEYIQGYFYAKPMPAKAFLSYALE